MTKTMPVEREPWPSRFDFGQLLKLGAVEWVAPELVAHVRYFAWTSDGLLRHAAYLGLREDEEAREIVH